MEIYSKLKKLESILQDKEIINYRVQIDTSDKTYLVTKIEQEKQKTHAIGFEIPSKNEYLE